jgi:hypothetical protein
LKKYFNRNYLNDLKIYPQNVISIVLITFGTFLISNPFFYTQRLGVVFTIIGFFLFVMKTNEKTTSYSKNFQIMFTMITWTIVVYLFIILTGLNIELIYFFVLIGLLVINEFKSKQISLFLNNRIDFAILIFFIISLILFIRKIISMAGT